MTQIKECILDILKSSVSFDPAAVTLDDSTLLADDLLIDSIIFISILVKIEQTFHISLDVASLEAPEYRTVGSLVRYIERLLL